MDPLILLRLRAKQQDFKTQILRESSTEHSSEEMQPLCTTSHSRTSAVSELIDCLYSLQRNADVVFNRIADRCKENRARIDTFSVRLTVAKLRLEKVKENHRKATVVMSPATFPSYSPMPTLIDVASTPESVSRHAPRYALPCASKTKVLTLPTKEEVSAFPVRPRLSLSHAGQAHVLGDGTSIASRIRPQLRATKSIPVPMKKQIPGGLSADYMRDSLKEWVEPYVPERTIAPTSFPKHLPGLEDFALDICFVSSDQPTFTATTTPAASLPQLPVAVEPLHQRAPFTTTTVPPTYSPAPVENALDTQVREEATKLALATQEQLERERRLKYDEDERRKLRAEYDAELRRQERQRCRQQASPQTQRNTSVPTTRTSEASSNAPASQDRDVLLPDTESSGEEERVAGSSSRAEDAAVAGDVYARGAESEFARELRDRAARTRGADVEARVAEAQKEQRARNRPALATMLLKAFESRYEATHGSGDQHSDVGGMTS